MALPVPTWPSTSETTYDELLERVRYDGAYPTREKAERVVATVLKALGPRLPEAERSRLAARLPTEAADHLQAGDPAPEPLTGWGFVKDLAEHTGAARATTRWDVGTVLLAVRPLAGESLITETLSRLPAGWALLFGRAELAPARAA